MTSASQRFQERGQPFSSSSKLKVTILASEWGSSKGGLSTVTRELAIQLAKYPEVQISFFVPQCSEDDKRAALRYNIEIVEATRRPGYDELEWLSFPPHQLEIDVVVGNGVKLGHQAQVIRESHHCRWIQVVHTDPEELGMFKSYPNSISTGEKKHKTEVELCEMADLVVGVGPKLCEAFRRYLRWCKKDQTILDITPGVFSEFVNIEHADEDRKQCGVLVFGRGDSEDFELKGFDIAGKAIAEVKDARLIFVGATEGKHEEIAERFYKCGISADRLNVKGFVRNRESLKRLFCEVDLVLMPSRTEGFGLTGLEALSAGLPVLVSANSGFGEALSKVPFGASCIIDSEDSRIWADAIERVWKKGRDTRLQEAEELRASYDRKYNWVAQSKSFVTKMISIHVNDSTDLQQKSARRKCEPSNSSITQVTKKMKLANDDNHAGTAAFVDSPEPTDVIERIRQLYKTREERVLPVPWCEDFSFHLNEIFTKLRIVGKDKTRGELTEDIIDMTAIFKSHEECETPRIVLIEGDLGMGKTTYCQKLAYDWATKQGNWDKSFPTITLLLLLRCQDIKSNIWEAIEEQILPDDIDQESKESFFKFIRENQSKILLVLDGLDEADQSKLGMYINLSQGRELPQCYVVFTSRHESGMKVRRYCDTLWEIVGFTIVDAESFIHKYFKDANHLARRLLREISQSRSDLRELTSNPLNTALLCILCEDFKAVFPTNRAELYMEIVQCVLRRYETKRGFFTNKEDLIEVYKDDLKCLGRMALVSLIEGQPYIETSRFTDSNSDVLTKFGFLSVQPGGSKRKPCCRYGFIHRSFQEFFAGFYLAVDMKIVTGEIDLDIAVTDERFLTELNQVFLFMTGIVVSQSEDSTLHLLRAITAHINSLGSSTSDDGFQEINRTTKLAFSFIEDCGNYNESLTSQLLHEFGSHLAVVPSTLKKSCYKNCIFESLSDNTTLTNLNLCNYKCFDSGAASISKALSVNTALTNLNLSFNWISASGASSLSDALKVNKTLTSLHLRGNRIGDPGAASLAEALSVNTSLTSLNLNNDDIGDSGAGTLSEALSVNTTLTYLDLSSNKIGDSGIVSLSEGLSDNTSLTHLNLAGNKIRAYDSAFLADALSFNATLTNLDLGGNRIGGYGATFLSEAISDNAVLTNLNLSFNEIGDSGVASLSEALSGNTTLTTLDLKGNRIGDSGAVALSKVLFVNSTLANLKLSENAIGIGDSGAASLSEALSSRLSTALMNLNLSFNNIGDSGGTSLCEALSVNNTLARLNLNGNKFSDSLQASFADARLIFSPDAGRSDEEACSSYETSYGEDSCFSDEASPWEDASSGDDASSRDDRSCGDDTDSSASSSDDVPSGDDKSCGDDTDSNDASVHSGYESSFIDDASLSDESNSS